MNDSGFDSRYFDLSQPEVEQERAEETEASDADQAPVSFPSYAKIGDRVFSRGAW